MHFNWTLILDVLALDSSSCHIMTLIICSICINIILLFPFSFIKCSNSSFAYFLFPQGGIQALETMLYTVDIINKENKILPNISIGVHILDDCDKDTYGLEQAVEFIKGNASSFKDDFVLFKRIVFWKLLTVTWQVFLLSLCLLLIATRIISNFCWQPMRDLELGIGIILVPLAYLQVAPSPNVFLVSLPPRVKVFKGNRRLYSLQDRAGI